jgi:hypothetical protein
VTISNSNRGRVTLLGLLIVAATLAAFCPLVTCDFTNWDDDHTVAENRALLPPTPASLIGFWDPSRPRGDLWIPVTYSTWWVVARFATYIGPSGEIALRPQWFHAVNLLVHVIAALALFAALRRIARDDRAACAGALLFALHPIQVEPVAWVSGLKDVLAGALGILAMWQYIRHAQAEPRAARRACGIALSSFAAATLAKPSAVALPLALAAIEVLLLHRRAVHVVRSLIPFVILAIPVAIVASIHQPATAVTTTVAWQLRPLVAADALAFYVYKLLVPLTYALDYGRTPQAVVHSGAIWWTWLGVAGLIVVAWRARRRAPLITTGICVFAAALLPVLGLRRFDFQEYSTVGDHYAYTAIAGAAMVLAGALSGTSRKFAFGLVAAVLVTLAVRSFTQTRHWRNTVTLFEHALAVNNESWAAANNLAQARIIAGELDGAEALLHRSLSLRPDNPDAHVNLGNVYARRERTADAVKEFRTAIRLDERSIEARVNLVASLAELGDLTAAAREFEQVLRIDPEHRAVRKMIDVAGKSRTGAVTLPSTSPGVFTDTPDTR